MTSNSTKSNNTGFPKGTRIVTKDGLKPIEDIQVGDYILSAPEDASGEPEYKQVIGTFRNKDQRIFKVVYFDPEVKPRKYFGVNATGSHLFWAEHAGWIKVDSLKKDGKIKLKDSSYMIVSSVDAIYKTDVPGVGWKPYSDLSLNEAQGSVFDYANYQVFEDKENKYRYILSEVYESADPFLKVDVFNLEVDSFRTYYITHGIWVHQQNG